MSWTEQTPSTTNWTEIGPLVNIWDEEYGLLLNNNEVVLNNTEDWTNEGKPNWR